MINDIVKCKQYEQHRYSSLIRKIKKLNQMLLFLWEKKTWSKHKIWELPPTIAPLLHVSKALEHHNTVKRSTKLPVPFSLVDISDKFCHDSCLSTLPKPSEQLEYVLHFSPPANLSPTSNNAVDTEINMTLFSVFQTFIQGFFFLEVISFGKSLSKQSAETVYYRENGLRA